MKEKDREDCRGGGSTLPRLGQSRYILIFLHPCGVWCSSLQDVLDGTPDGRSMTRLGKPRLGALFEKHCAIGTQRIPREKNHPLGQVTISINYESIKILTVKVRHTQVTQEDIIAMDLNLG